MRLLTLALWLVGAWLALVWAQGEPARPTLGVALRYQPERLEEELNTLKAAGVSTVLVPLEQLPRETEWARLVETLEASGLEWWLGLRQLPRAEAWVCAPERYRIAGNEEGIYPIQLPGASQTLIAVSPADTPSLRTLAQLALSGGQAVYAQGDTANSVLLLYPRYANAMPDLWEGWDRYRDGLIRLLRVRAPKTGFRGWVVESHWDALAIASFPTSTLARVEWEGFLRARYAHLVELERAWDVSSSLRDYADAAQRLPMWREGRGLPFLIAPDDSRKPLEVNPNRSRFWSDYHEFLAERWNTLLTGLRDALQRYTPEAAFVVVRPAEDRTELSLPAPFKAPLLPNGIRLPEAWRSIGSLLLTLEAAEFINQPYPVQALVIEGVGNDVERASLLQARARALGVRTLFWEASPDQIGSAWQTLHATDSPPEKPQFLPFPAGLWGATSIQKFPAGWWVPSSADTNLRPVVWGFDLPGFWRIVEVQRLDKTGQTVVANLVELTLWSAEGEQEVVLRRLDRNPLEAMDLNGNPVKLDLKGEMVRLRVGTIPVRIRGFEALPFCESCVEQWIRRAEELLKRPSVGGQDPSVLKFHLQGAQELYRKDRAPGFEAMRSAWFEVERAYMPYRWYEAETARLHTFGTVRRDASASGGATLWLRSPIVGNFFAQYPLPIRAEGSYTFWLAVRLQGSRELGKVRWQLFQDTAGATPVAQGESDLRPERAQSAYADQFAWFSIGSVGLRAGDYTLKLEWLPNGTKPPYAMEWDVVLIAPAGIQPAGNRFPRY